MKPFKRKNEGNTPVVETTRKKYLSWRRLRALCLKETFQIMRDPSSILIAFVLPIILLLIFGFGISLDSNRLHIGIVLEDQGSHGQKLASSIAASPYISPHWSQSRAEMQKMLDVGKVRGMVVIPADFSKQLNQSKGMGSSQYGKSDMARIQIIADGAQPNTANFVVHYARGAWLAWQEGEARAAGVEAPPGIDLVVRYWFNPTTVSKNYLIPGAISVVMTIIGALLTSMVIAREWERGTMEALLTTPMTQLEFLLSKIIPYYVLGMISMGICVWMATVLMDVPFRGSLALFFISSSLFMGSALGMGLLISTVSRNQFNAAQMALNIAFLPAVLLSGFMFEIANMPKLIQIMAYIIPARYFVAVSQTLFQAGQVWSVILINLLFLTLSTVFWLGLTAYKTKRNLDK